MPSFMAARQTDVPARASPWVAPGTALSTLEATWLAKLWPRRQARLGARQLACRQIAQRPGGKAGQSFAGRQLRYACGKSAGERALLGVGQTVSQRQRRAGSGQRGVGDIGEPAVNNGTGNPQPGGKPPQQAASKGAFGRNSVRN